MQEALKDKPTSSWSNNDKAALSTSMLSRITCTGHLTAYCATDHKKSSFIIIRHDYQLFVHLSTYTNQIMSLLTLPFFTARILRYMFTWTHQMSLLEYLDTTHSSQAWYSKFQSWLRVSFNSLKNLRFSIYSTLSIIITCTWVANTPFIRSIY